MLTLDRAANGHAVLHTESWLVAMKLSAILCLQHGFRRCGEKVVGFDETLYPDFVRGNLRILAGWDHWMGYHFLSDGAEADQFLTAFFQRHGPP